MGVLDQLAAELGISPATLADRVLRPPVNESLTPTYLTIDPATGAVSASFSGSITLPESTAAFFQQAHTVAWTDSTTVREWIQGNVSGTTHFLQANANPDATDFSGLLLEAATAGAAGSAQVGVLVQDSTGPLFAKQLLDSTLKSHWLQLPSAQQLQLALGTGSVTWGGGTVVASQTINHGIGRTPTVVMVCPWGNPSDGAGAVDFGSVDHTTYTSTQFIAAVTRSGAAPAAGTTCSYDWIAVG